MPKKFGNLWGKLVSMENIKEAYRKARKGKSWYRQVREIEASPDFYLGKIRQMLVNKSYVPSPYTEKIIREPKKRTIYKVPFYPDRIIHHAVMNVVAPLWEKMWIDKSYSCRKGYGQHRGVIQCMQFVKRNRYCLKCDISKFYPSVDHEILKSIILRKIKDKNIIWLLFIIIDSYPGETNIPIGNYTSGIFGNLYLNELDTFVKQVLHCKDYMRYCDDFVLLNNNKSQLQEWKKALANFLANNLRLSMSKNEVFPTSQGIDFLGYRMFPQGRHGYILVRKRTVRKMKKRMKQLPYMDEAEKRNYIASINGILKWANTYNLKEFIGEKYGYTAIL